MIIKLVQSGGFIPLTKEASVDVDWCNEKSHQMIKQLAVPFDNSSSMVRDGIAYAIEIDGKVTPVNLDNASGKFAKVLNELKSNLKIVKT